MGEDAYMVFDTSSIPNDFAMSLEDIAPNITSLIQGSSTDNRTWYDTLASIIPNLTATYEQKQLLDAQIERARLGLPPIGVTDSGLSKDTIQLLIFGGVILGGVLWFASQNRPRRR